MGTELTDRQLNEIEYHKSYAEKNANKEEEPVSLHVIEEKTRRWWNAYWHTYSILLRHDLNNMNVLVPGCGFGDDAIRIASLGANVHAFDISPEIVEIAKRRSKRILQKEIKISEMPCESLNYESDFFDYVFFIDILHHVDISRSATEIQRVSRKGAYVIGNELYTHSGVEKNIRQSWIVKNILYPKMQNYIYDNRDPYITEDEHKINESEFQEILGIFSDCEINYFNTVVGRIFPDKYDFISKVDRISTRTLGDFGRFFAGRVVFEGSIGK